MSLEEAAQDVAQFDPDAPAPEDADEDIYGSIQNVIEDGAADVYSGACGLRPPLALGPGPGSHT